MARISKTAGIPFHQDSEPTAIGNVGNDIHQAAGAIVQSIIASHRKSGSRSYLFVDPASREVYVLPEERPSSLRWVRERFSWLVGLYGDIRAANRDTAGMTGRTRNCRTARVPGLLVTVDALADDLREHLDLPAPLPGASSTAAPAKPCANGTHSKSGSPRGGCKLSARAIGEVVRHG